MRNKRDALVLCLLVVYFVIMLIITLGGCGGGQSFEYISEKIADCKGPGFSTAQKPFRHVLLPWLSVVLFPAVLLLYEQALWNLSIVRQHEEQTAVQREEKIRLTGAMQTASAVAVRKHPDMFLGLSYLLQAIAMLGYFLLVFWNIDSDEYEFHYAATGVLFASWVILTLLLLVELNSVINLMRQNQSEDEEMPCCSTLFELKSAMYSMGVLLLPIYVVCLVLFAFMMSVVFEFVLVAVWLLALLCEEKIWRDARLHIADSEFRPWVNSFLYDYLALLSVVGYVPRKVMQLETRRPQGEL